MSASPKLPPFDPADPLGLDDLLSEEDRAIRDTVRTWAADRVLPHIADWYEKGELPGIRELARELGLHRRPGHVTARVRLRGRQLPPVRTGLPGTGGC